MNTRSIITPVERLIKGDVIPAAYANMTDQLVSVEYTIHRGVDKVELQLKVGHGSDGGYVHVYPLFSRGYLVPAERVRFAVLRDLCDLWVEWMRVR